MQSNLYFVLSLLSRPSCGSHAGQLPAFRYKKETPSQQA
jgi:hypothetical protein